jgi:phosphonate transport system ATP-binding protein
MLTLHDAEVTYPNGTAALRRTTLRVEAGAFTVLLGASGAGKSTLLRVMNGLVAPTHGAVVHDTLGTLNSAARWRAHRRACGMVFQQHHLIGRVSVLGNVLLGRVGAHSTLRTLWPLPHADRELALDALERVGLLALANRRADQLSGGQQQRVGIARAQVQKPALLLADEPVASLDPASAIAALQRMHDICRADRIAAVVSLHQVTLAQRFADRVVGLAGGRVVFDGAAAALTDGALESLYGGASRRPPETRPMELSDVPTFASA